MTLSPGQLHQLLELLDQQLAIFVGSSLGTEYLTEQQQKVLTDSGVDLAKLYDQAKDPVLLNFHLGQLSDVMGNSVQNLSFDQLRRHIASGQHFALSARERATINSVKQQALADIRANQGRIFQDVNNVVVNKFNETRANQEAFLREQVELGLSRRQSVKAISHELARLTGDWTRNFQKSVQYISHTALNEGRLSILQQRYEHPGDAKVYFIVQQDACEHCVRCYLTAGPGSAPRVFSVRELLANGNNIGRKAKDYKATIAPIHPHCRCLLTEHHEGTTWNGHQFTRAHLPTYVPTVKRSKIKVLINGVEHHV